MQSMDGLTANHTNHLICDSPIWDSHIFWWTGSPHLSTCFRQTILVAIPPLLLLLLTPLDFRYFNQRPQSLIKWQLKNISSAVLNVILIAISIGLLVRIVLKPVLIWSAIYEPSVDLTGFSMSFALLLMYKQNGRRISIALQMYWFFTSIVSIIRLYFEYITEDKREKAEQNLRLIYQIVYSLYISLSILLFILSSICDNISNRMRLYEDQRYWETTEDNTFCALENDSAFGRLTLFWLSKFLRKGFRQTIVTKDLNELCFTLKSKYLSKLFNKFDRKYNSNAIQRLSRLYRKQNKRLLPILWGLHSDLIAISFLLLGVYLPALYSQPLILNKLLDFLSDPTELEWHGMVYALAYCLTGLVATFSLQHCDILMENNAIRCKSALTSAVYRKVFCLSPGARRIYTQGEIVNIMAADCHQIFLFVSLSHYWLIVPIGLTIGFYLLWHYLGIASVGCIIVMALVSPASAAIGHKLDKLQKKQMQYKDKRMAKISEILNSIKIIKLNAWEQPFIEMVAKIRNLELKSLLNLALLYTIIDLIWIMAPMLVASACFSIYAYTDYSHFDATTIFVSLAILNIIRVPMAIIPAVFSRMIRAIVSHRRVSKFLNAEELHNYLTVGAQRDDSVYSIRIQSASFGYCLEELPILSDISIDVSKGALIAVIGEVGAGKSSLLSAIIGNLYKIKGRIEVKGRVAYVPQTAWIQNTSLKNNIVFMSDEDEQKYQEVLSACALLPDLDVLPAKDQTEIGEKGINLSGGQKQRVSLARAVYRDSDIYLLDDPLSAVDAHVGKHLFDKVIGPKGLLRSKTRIMCTHNLSFLQNCDQIYVLRDGQVVGFGDYKELSSLGLLSQIEISHMKRSEKLSESDVNSDKISINRLVSYESMTSADMSGDTLKDRRSSDPLVNQNIIEDEVLVLGSVRWRDYGRYVLSTGIIGFTAFVLLRIGFNGSEAGANYWLSLWSNRNTSANDTSDRTEGLVIYSSLVLSEALFILFGDIVLFLCSVRASRLIHAKALYGVLRSPLSFFDKTPTGRVLNRFSKDISSVDEEIPGEVAGAFEKMTWFPILYLLIATTFPYLAIALLAVIALFYAIYKIYLSTCRQFRRLESISNSPVQSHFCESISGAQSIKAFDALHQFIDESNKRLDLSLNCYYHRMSLNYWLRLWANMVGAIITLMVSVYIAYNRQQISVGLAGLLLTYAVEAVNWVTFLIRNTAALETDMISFERLREFTELSPESDWKSSEKSKPPDSWPLNGCVQFQNYSTTYRLGLKPVLEDVNFVVKSRERIGICGRTGAGKSSLTLALFRIIEPINGRILIDGLDIQTIGLHDLRSRLTIIPQDPILFADTLRTNLDPFHTYSDSQLWTALENSNLTDFVRQLPEGLDYEVTEGGDNLSGGQKQLVCLARALLRGSRILVLDEAMSACDLETDRVIQKTIREKFNECTVITIAHRLNTIIDYDRILVLEFGRVVENDSPKNLLLNEKSVFYSLAKEAKLI